MNVTLDQANRMIAAAVEEAKSRGIRMTAVVVDAGGHPVAMQRMDGGSFTGPVIGQRKAFTAANFRTPTASMRERLSDVAYQVQITAADDRLTFLAGGVPIPGPDGSVIGAIAVCGPTSSSDIELCEIALSALAESPLEPA